MKTFIIVILFLISAFEPSFAQIRKPQVTGDIVADTKANLNVTKSSASVATLTPDQLWQKIVAASAADLAYAKALSDNVKSVGSGLRSNCYGAIITANEQANGVNLKDLSGNALTKPDPALVTLFEQVAEIADNLQPTSPLMVACAPAANALKMSIAQLISMAVSGAASLSALGIAIP